MRKISAIHAGALAGDATHCAANAETRAWLKRARLDADAYAAQHRMAAATPGAPEGNLAESPLTRLATEPPPLRCWPKPWSVKV